MVKSRCVPSPSSCPRPPCRCLRRGRWRSHACAQDAHRPAATPAGRPTSRRAHPHSDLDGARGGSEPDPGESRHAAEQAARVANSARPAAASTTSLRTPRHPKVDTPAHLSCPRSRAGPVCIARTSTSTPPATGGWRRSQPRRTAPIEPVGWFSPCAKGSTPAIGAPAPTSRDADDCHSRAGDRRRSRPTRRPTRTSTGLRAGRPRRRTSPS